MPFTPPETLVVRSIEHSDGSEFEGESASSNIIPDHYVKRLWRKKLLVGDGFTIQFTDKSSESNPSVLYTAVQRGSKMTITGEASDVFSAVVNWASGSGRALEKSSVTLGPKTGLIKEIIKKTGILTSSRVFTGPDGLEYKWKQERASNDSLFPDPPFLTLYAKDSNRPVATTQRLAARDGSHSETSYPLYIDDRGVAIQGWIVATLCVVEKLQT